MRPANHHKAERQMHNLLIRRLPGKKQTAVNEHLKRAKQIALILWKYDKVGPYQYQLKHLQWYLTTQINTLKPASQYRHWLTVERILKALNKYKDWQSHLQGTWRKPD